MTHIADSITSEDYAVCTLVASMHNAGEPRWRDTELARQSQRDFLLLHAHLITSTP